MKQVNNRQNKTFQIQRSAPPQRKEVSPVESRYTDPLLRDPSNAGYVVGLIKEMFLAGKITQAARLNALNVHLFDHADDLRPFMQTHKICFCILDWDHLEAESFKFLNALKDFADLKRVPVIGYLSQAKQDLMELAKRAGCDRVYGKTEFHRSLNDFMMRYAR